MQHIKAKHRKRLLAVLLSAVCLVGALGGTALTGAADTDPFADDIADYPPAAADFIPNASGWIVNGTSNPGEPTLGDGLLATDACRADPRGRVHTVEVVPGTEPTESCARHVFVSYCTEGQCVAGENCPESSVESRVLLDYDREVFQQGDGTPIPVGDSAYILKNNQPEEGCPVHQHPVEPVDPVEPTDPTEPDPPAEGGDTGDGDWFGNLWGG